MCGFFIKLALHVGKPLLYTAWVVNDAKFEVTEFVCSRPTQFFFQDNLLDYLFFCIYSFLALGLGKLSFSKIQDFQVQLISKCPFGVFKSTKKSTKCLLGFLP